jgi:predicted nucleotidyltransferase
VPAPTREALFDTLAQVTRAFEEHGVPFIVGGGLAAEAYHLRETINDIDVFVKPIDAPAALRVLTEAGFHTWIEDPRWLYKGIKDGTTVDIIYESSGLVHVGDETFRRARRLDISGIQVPIMPPEDLIVMKAVAATPAAPKHWVDAISLLVSHPIDWEYLAGLSTRNPRKVLNVILHAYEDGVDVPSFVFARLAQQLIS